MKTLVIVGAIATILIAGSLVGTATLVNVQQSVCQTQVTGVLMYTRETFSVNDVILHLGPRWIMKITMSPFDYDCDGTMESVFAELQGLAGTTVTVSGHLHEDGSLSVFSINDLPYTW